nr:regucalcin isoform X1 [Helicoverpa armigera]
MAAIKPRESIFRTQSITTKMFFHNHNLPFLTNVIILALTSIKPMAPVVKPVTEPVWLGEGPHWDHEEQALYFVSIFDHTVHKYVPETNKHTRAKLDGMPTFIIPVEGKKHHFVVGLNRQVVEIQWDGQDHTAKVVKTIVEVDQDNPKNRFNDAKADPRGRLFAGTMGHEYEPGKFHLKKGSLYRIDHDGSAHKLASDIDISNGLCWDLRENAFYFADSFEYTIRRYDYDVDTGNISNPRNVFAYKDHGLEGIVDGMTIDTDGNLWVANFDGNQVLKIDPRTSALLQKIPIPALQVTSATFGGPALDVLYVTSAAMNRGQEQHPPAGATFTITGTGAKGHPNNYVRLN